MIAPLAWLKEYIDITLTPELLGEKLTEVGLGTEKIRHEGSDTILELEITPNRPDWLSIIGVAREIAAIENKKIKYPALKTDLKPKKGTKLLPFTIHPDFSCSERMTGILIHGVTVQESPTWLKDRLVSVGLRPINSIVDITNYVMWELGNPIHSFDYDKIATHEMWVKQAKSGENFESVDGIQYHLPKGAIIYEDKDPSTGSGQGKIFDLAGIKGGKNSGTYADTKTVFILVPVDNPVLIRKASQALGLRSDASAIFERAVNKGGTMDALKRAVDLILEIAGGEIASELIDLKEKDFKPWKLDLRLDRLEFILGIKIPEKEVTDILERLNLSPKIVRHPEREKRAEGSSLIIECTIPTYRNDLQIEEDLIEEVARMYGYNNFPKTMPEGQIPTVRVPYFRDFRQDELVKRYIAATGYSEIYTYSLISEGDLESSGINSEDVLRVDNPVSRDFEYLRPTLKVNLLKALRQNKANFSSVNLFEMGKVYLGKNLDTAKESYHLAGISNTKAYVEVKGILEELFDMLGIVEDPTKYLEILDEGVYFEIPFAMLLESAKVQRKFVPVPKYPSISEDISLTFGKEIQVGEVIDVIEKISPLITNVSLVDMYENTRTFHIVYLDRTKNLTTEEVAKVREEILSILSKKFDAKVK